MRLTHLAVIGAALLWIAASSAAAADNELTDQEKKDGWQLLFNGADHTGWKCNNGRKIAAPIEDGTLVPYRSGGYVIIHEKQFGDFTLKCDVKMPEHCNSGVFFRVADPKNPVNTGFEVQVASGAGVGMHAFGAIYDLASTTKNTTKGPGKWNHMEITCRGPEISVKLNGEMVCRINCDEFDKPGLRPDGSRHKFKNYDKDGHLLAIKDFARRGYLGFQDHGSKVWYKNVKVLELK